MARTNAHHWPPILQRIPVFTVPKTLKLCPALAK